MYKILVKILRCVVVWHPMEACLTSMGVQRIIRPPILPTLDVFEPIFREFYDAAYLNITTKKSCSVSDGSTLPAITNERSMASGSKIFTSAAPSCAALYRTVPGLQTCIEIGTSIRTSPSRARLLSSVPAPAHFVSLSVQFIIFSPG